MELLKIMFILIIGIYIGSYINIKEHQCSKRLKNIINTLIRQSARWSTASGQDKSPIIAVLHANYGVGYLSALKEIVTEEEIKQYSGINLQKFSKQIIQQQDKATLYAVKNCKNYAKDLNPYLAKIAKEKD
jgi:hypothetical protein